MSHVRLLSASLSQQGNVTEALLFAHSKARPNVEKKQME
jgi:hypothetical protein